MEEEQQPGAAPSGGGVHGFFSHLSLKQKLIGGGAAAAVILGLLASRRTASAGSGSMSTGSEALPVTVPTPIFIPVGGGGNSVGGGSSGGVVAPTPTPTPISIPDPVITPTPLPVTVPSSPVQGGGAPGGAGGGGGISRQPVNPVIPPNTNIPGSPVVLDTKPLVIDAPPVNKGIVAAPVTVPANMQIVSPSMTAPPVTVPTPTTKPAQMSQQDYNNIAQRNQDIVMLMNGQGDAGALRADIARIDAVPTVANAANSNDRPIGGFGGANYYNSPADVQAGIVQNENRLSSDPSFVASEVQRTQDVIAAREAAGVDTSMQTTYAAHLADVQAAQNSSSSLGTDQTRDFSPNPSPQPQPDNQQAFLENLANGVNPDGSAADAGNAAWAQAQLDNSN